MPTSSLYHPESGSGQTNNSRGTRLPITQSHAAVSSVAGSEQDNSNSSAAFDLSPPRSAKKHFPPYPPLTLSSLSSAMPPPFRTSLHDAVLVLQGAAIGALLLLLLQAASNLALSHQFHRPLDLNLGFSGELSLLPAWLDHSLTSTPSSHSSSSPSTLSPSPFTAASSVLHESEQQRVHEQAVDKCDDDVQLLTDCLSWNESSAVAFSHIEVTEGGGMLGEAYGVDGKPFDDGCRQRAFFDGRLILHSLPPDVPHTFHASSSTKDAREHATEDTRKVYVPLSLDYDPMNSTHMVCFQLPLPGSYRLSLHLLFTNTFKIIRTHLEENSEGFKNYSLVLNRHVTAHAPSDYELFAYRSSLPLCTLSSLSHSQPSPLPPSYGFWLGIEWLPSACRLAPLSHDQLFACLDGKKILMLGDSELRYTFATFAHMMDEGGRQAYFRLHGNHPEIFYSMGSLGRRLSNWDPPIDQETGKPPFLPWLSTHWHGIMHDGFIRINFTQPPTPPSSSSSPSSSLSPRRAFSLSYVTHLGFSRPLFAPWMLNQSMTSGEVVFDGQPFDAVVTTSLLHEVVTHPAVVGGQTMRELSEVFLPNLQQVLRRDVHTEEGSERERERERGGDRVTFFGPWWGREERKKAMHLPGSNNPRGLALSRTVKRELAASSSYHFIPMRFITSPRPDLNLDSTHYMWPVSMAMIDLWLHSYCYRQDDMAAVPQK